MIQDTSVGSLVGGNEVFLEDAGAANTNLNQCCGFQACFHCPELLELTIRHLSKFDQLITDTQKRACRALNHSYFEKVCQCARSMLFAEPAIVAFQSSKSPTDHTLGFCV